MFRLLCVFIKFTRISGSFRKDCSYPPLKDINKLSLVPVLLKYFIDDKGTSYPIRRNCVIFIDHYPFLLGTVYYSLKNIKLSQTTQRDLPKKKETINRGFGTELNTVIGDVQLNIEKEIRSEM